MGITLGKFIKNEGTYENNVDYGKTKITFYIEDDKEVNKEEAIKVLNIVSEDIDNFLKKIYNYAFENLAPIANEYWLDEEYDEPLTKQDFADGVYRKICFNQFLEDVEKELISADFWVRDFSIYITMDKKGDLIRAELS